MLAVTPSLSRARPLLLRFLTTTPPPPPPPLSDFPSLNESSLSYFLDKVKSSSPNSPSHKCGFPEVIVGTGLSPFQVSSILTSLSSSRDAMGESHTILATRVSAETFKQLPSPSPDWRYCPIGQCISSPPSSPPPSPPYKKTVLLITAGPSDLPVAEEAALALAACSIPAARLLDCNAGGGLHRIVSSLPLLASPDVSTIITFTGADGALPSVVAGLVDVPVIAVQTSEGGRGLGAGGMVALGAVLNSCGIGVVAVNVDDGVGAAAAAFKICKQAGKREGGSVDEGKATQALEDQDKDRFGIHAQCQDMYDTLWDCHSPGQDVNPDDAPDGSTQVAYWTDDWYIFRTKTNGVWRYSSG